MQFSSQLFKSTNLRNAFVIWSIFKWILVTLGTLKPIRKKYTSTIWEFGLQICFQIQLTLWYNVPLLQTIFDYGAFLQGKTFNYCYNLLPTRKSMSRIYYYLRPSTLIRSLLPYKLYTPEKYKKGLMHSEKFAASSARHLF